jgi:hypothetical protein
MKFSQCLSVAAAFASSVSALPHAIRRGGGNGGVTVVNNMAKTVYLWSVANVANDSMVTLNHGQTYEEDWRVNSNGGGVSLKISTTPEQQDVLQYEYTLASPTIFWDLSCIDMGTGSEFTTVGFAVTSDNPSCVSATCKPGDSACAAAYLFPTDDHATHGCDASTHMTLNLGPSQSE